jgi:hypothetical protein
LRRRWREVLRSGDAIDHLAILVDLGHDQLHFGDYAVLDLVYEVEELNVRYGGRRPLLCRLKKVGLDPEPRSRLAPTESHMRNETSGLAACPTASSVLTAPFQSTSGLRREIVGRIHTEANCSAEAHFDRRNEVGHDIRTGGDCPP